MSKLIFASLLLTSLVGTPAGATIAVKMPAPIAAPAADTAKSADASAQKICRWVERSGTHAKQKFCLTKEEWQQVDNDRG